MPIVRPLNDTECLVKVHQGAAAYAATPEARELAEQLGSVELAQDMIRHLDQRDDLGRSDDGPRIECDVSQRLRLPALDPNCLERTAMYLALVSIIEPERPVTSATLTFQEALHTFPVEIFEGIPRSVVLDPVAEPIQPAMNATAWLYRNASPMARQNIAPWFHQVAQTACQAHGLEDCYHTAMDGLRNSLLTGEPITHPDELACVLELTELDADLYGGRGRAAHEQVCRSIRNLSLSIDRGLVKSLLKEMAKMGGPYAGEALKVALIAKFGPAAAIAFQDKQLILPEPGQEDDEEPDHAPDPKSRKTKSQQKLSREQRRMRVQRLALGFRPPT